MWGKKRFSFSFFNSELKIFSFCTWDPADDNSAIEKWLIFIYLFSFIYFFMFDGHTNHLEILLQCKSVDLSWGLIV